MPSLLSVPSARGALSVCLFGAAVLYAAAVSAACGCFSCLSGQACMLRTADSGDVFEEVFDPLTPDQAEEEVPFAEFRLNGRWSNTAGTGGSTGSRGNPATVTWGFVADGTPVSSGGNSLPSSLLAMLNTQYGAGPGGVTNAPWFPLVQSAFDRWSQVSGITYVYEPADGGAPLDGTASPLGQRGVYADVRIGGRSIDGSSGPNTLAFNYFPNHGDMVLDTDNASFYGNREFNSRRLRNVLMHEAGHGLGFNHLESNDSGQLMEPSISTTFDGPQIDDILAAQRNYGDPLEKAGGNDSPRIPTQVGALGAGDSWVVGSSGSASVVTSAMSDFVSIDGASDTDYFRFTVTEPVLLDLTLTQVGRSYNEGPQDGAQTRLDASRFKPLNLRLLSAEAGTGLAVHAESTPRGDIQRFITGELLVPGRDYFVHVLGLNTVDNVQLYRLNLGLIAAAIPEPAGVALVAAFAFGVVASRRRAA